MMGANHRPEVDDVTRTVTRTLQNHSEFEIWGSGGSDRSRGSRFCAAAFDLSQAQVKRLTLILMKWASLTLV